MWSTTKCTKQLNELFRCETVTNTNAAYSPAELHYRVQTVRHTEPSSISTTTRTYGSTTHVHRHYRPANQRSANACCRSGHLWSLLPSARARLCAIGYAFRRLVLSREISRRCRRGWSERTTTTDRWRAREARPGCVPAGRGRAGPVPWPPGGGLVAGSPDVDGQRRPYDDDQEEPARPLPASLQHTPPPSKSLQQWRFYGEYGFHAPQNLA